jgi:hypothetical protein
MANQNIPKLGFFGMKINHPATPTQTPVSFSSSQKLKITSRLLRAGLFRAARLSELSTLFAPFTFEDLLWTTD